MVFPNYNQNNSKHHDINVLYNYSHKYGIKIVTSKMYVRPHN